MNAIIHNCFYFLNRIMLLSQHCKRSGSVFFIKRFCCVIWLIAISPNGPKKCHVVCRMTSDSKLQSTVIVLGCNQSKQICGKIHSAGRGLFQSYRYPAKPSVSAVLATLIQMSMAFC